MWVPQICLAFWWLVTRVYVFNQPQWWTYSILHGKFLEFCNTFLLNYRPKRSRPPVLLSLFHSEGWEPGHCEYLNNIWQKISCLVARFALKKKKKALFLFLYCLQVMADKHQLEKACLSWQLPSNLHSGLMGHVSLQFLITISSPQHSEPLLSQKHIHTLQTLYITDARLQFKDAVFL